MEFYEKRSKWYVVTDTGSKHKFVKKTKAIEFMESLKKEKTE